MQKLEGQVLGYLLLGNTLIGIYKRLFKLNTNIHVLTI